MMKELTISVITPSYNQGRFIERTIKSVLNQDIHSLEYIIIDGGSTDDTLKILKRHEGQLKWISERDKGQSDAVNKGIMLSNGDIIGWLNSDDIYYPGALKKVLSFFEIQSKTDIIYGDADFIDTDDNIIEPYYTEDWNYERLKKICFICQPAVFFRRRLIAEFGVLDERLKYNMDYEYWLRIGAYKDFFRIKQKLAGSRLYAGNKTLKNRIAVRRETNNMLSRKFGSVSGTWIMGYAYEVAEKMVSDRTNPIKKGVYLCILILASLIASIKWTPNFKTEHKKSKVYKAVGILLSLSRAIICFPAKPFKKITAKTNVSNNIFWDRH